MVELTIEELLKKPDLVWKVSPVYAYLLTQKKEKLYLTSVVQIRQTPTAWRENIMVGDDIDAVFCRQKLGQGLLLLIWGISMCQRVDFYE